MKPAVHLGVGRLVALVHAPLCEQGIAVVQTGVELAQERFRGAVLGNAPCRKSLEDAPDVDRVEHVAGRERAHDVAPAFVHGEQPFLREQRQCLAHRGAGHAELLRQRGLRHPLPGASLPRRIISRRRTTASSSCVLNEFPRRLARAHAAW